MIELTIAEVDTFLSANGQFSLLDWLLEKNMIAFVDFERWRYGQIPVLVDAGSLSQEDLASYCEAAQKVCSDLKLSSEVVDYFGWGENLNTQLYLSKDKSIQRQLATLWKSPESMPQLDLFFDNSAAVAENQLVDALANNHIQQAQTQLDKLTQLNSSHARLGGYLDLLNYIKHTQANRVVDQTAMQAELDGLEGEVAPLATELLGSKKRDFLAFAWRRIANSLQDQPFNAQTPKLHSSYALQQIPDWQTLRKQLLADTELKASAELMARLATAYWHSHQVEDAMLVWGLAMDRFGDQAETYLERCNQEPILQLWDDFLTFSESWENSAFLGFLIIRKPGLIHRYKKLQQAVGDIVQAYNNTIVDLFNAKIASNDETQCRAELQKSHSTLLQYYLTHRS